MEVGKGKQKRGSRSHSAKRGRSVCVCKRNGWRGEQKTQVGQVRMCVYARVEGGMMRLGWGREMG